MEIKKEPFCLYIIFYLKIIMWFRKVETRKLYIWLSHLNFQQSNNCHKITILVLDIIFQKLTA